MFRESHRVQGSKKFFICVFVFEYPSVLDSGVASLKKTHRQVDYIYLHVIKDDEVLCQ